MKPPTGATPLIAIAAAAIDTETTGLDATKARMVRIGAIGIRRARSTGNFSSISSSIPVKQSRLRLRASTASRTTGFGGAASFPDAWARFQEFVGPRILVGHSIGFDLAVLEGECRRASLPWNEASGVVRAGFLRAWRIPIWQTNRWTGSPPGSAWRLSAAIRLWAMPIAAGDIFVALIPELRKRNIRTLGEAEVACLGLSRDLEAGHRAELGRAGVATSGSRVSSRWIHTPIAIASAA